MVHFSGLLQLRLFNDLCSNFCHNWCTIVVYHCLNLVIYLVKLIGSQIVCFNCLAYDVLV